MTRSFIAVYTDIWAMMANFQSTFYASLTWEVITEMLKIHTTGNTPLSELNQLVHDEVLAKCL
jgi:hypothetical protein